MMGSLGKLRAALLFSVAFAPALFCQKQGQVVGANAWLQVTAVAPPKPGSAPQLTPAQWHEDLRFLSSQLARRHANAFHFISQEAFGREVQELDGRLDQLNPDQIFVGMDRIENSVGDGHTYIRLPSDSPVYPVRFGHFSDQYRLLAAADSLHSPEVAGGRLLSIDDVPVARVHELLLTLTPADEMQPLREVRATALLSNGLVLHGLGITAERDKARYLLLATDGKRVSLELAATSGALGSEAGWIQTAAGSALYLQHGEDGFWCTYLEDKRTGYCGFRSYKDLKTTSRALKDLMTRQHPENLVIDLRLNDGGDYTLGLKYVVNPIRRAREINHKGHLFVLIGPRTFSAAMANASHFRAKTKAILVGQPIGEKPNSYQEARDMVLPNSRWVARYSVKFYRFSSSGGNLIRPDKEIADTWDDYRMGRDPVLAWVLLQVSEEQKQANPEANIPIPFYVQRKYGRTISEAP
jgi:hypothetical protein